MVEGLEVEGMVRSCVGEIEEERKEVCVGERGKEVETKQGKRGGERG